MDPLIRVEGLKKLFPVRKGLLSMIFSKKAEYVHAVDGVSFTISKGEIFGLAGESGCGKTTTGRLLLRLVEPTEGSVYFEGEDIFSLSGRELMRKRREMQMIFQDPYKSLDPKKTVKDIINEPLSIHKIGKNRREKLEIIYEMLEAVKLTPPEDYLFKYPHELSGGERQRVAIARAIILKPKFIVADEPVSMLDVSIRASILDLMIELKDKFNLTYLYITHDLSVASYLCNKLAIMYLGKLVELGDTLDLVKDPLHPYTKMLISAVPVPDPTYKREGIRIRGEVGNPINPPSGCRFHPRCPFATDKCREVEPHLVNIGNKHFVACHLIGG
ncbi:MAG: oligopeptide ABC transporter ATP-binding protein [Thermoproteota archaeon]|nr:MAG: oligopeptide ABC transporter ATP-binding protein [Candidatus Korarchaeota archaeon]